MIPFFLTYFSTRDLFCGKWCGEGFKIYNVIRPLCDIKVYICVVEGINKRKA